MRASGLRNKSRKLVSYISRTQTSQAKLKFSSDQKMTTKFHLATDNDIV